MANPRPAISIAIILLISACASRSDEAWVATKETAVYASANDTETKVLFTIAPGETCTPLRDVEMKVYLHTEIECDKRRGWVTDDRDFEIKRAS